MTGSSIGVAVIGYGWMGRLHAQAYLRLRHHYPQLPVPRLIGVADPEADRPERSRTRTTCVRACWTRCAGWPPSGGSRTYGSPTPRPSHSEGAMMNLEQVLAEGAVR